ncbi:cation:dicarboxylate symporter family transporter [Thorsellia kenyensis]|uniref:Cation:dicarboxylate symporter family transporter n=1 Tax=Thorsellia kenyensis TaxID=1549888 RepID=A0ABV6CBQ5_9GAMM
MTDAPSSAIFNGVLFQNFLHITHYQTLLSLLLLGVFFYVIKFLQDKKTSFSIRMMAGLVLGGVLGFVIQTSAGYPPVATMPIWMKETATWYGLFGRAFVAFIRMLVIPLIFVSIVKVILDFSGKENLPKVAVRSIFWLLSTTAVAAVVGIGLASLLGLELTNTQIANTTKVAEIREYKNLVDTLVNLIPSNIIGAMSSDNVVGLVIFSALLGIGANRMEKKNPEAIGAFKLFINGLYKIVMSIAMTIIKYMPYAVIALLARTIVSNGMTEIYNVSSFVLAIYIATAIMLFIHVLLVMIHGISPLMFIKKAAATWLMAFTSRSSVGTLPMTISTLKTRMGVNAASANLVGSLGSTIGMNGCAGFFPALLAVMLAQTLGIEINLQFYLMLVLVVVLGSIGIAGIPGTATIAASITLSGMGMGEYFPMIAVILAIDPIIDMARTLANVSGTMTAAVITDKEMGTMDMTVFNDPSVQVDLSDDSNQIS